MARIEMTPLKKLVLRVLLVYVVVILILIAMKFVRTLSAPRPPVRTAAVMTRFARTSPPVMLSEVAGRA